LRRIGVLVLVLLAGGSVLASSAAAQPTRNPPGDDALAAPAPPPLLVPPAQPSPPPARGPEDAFGRGTPRGAVRGFLEAARESDWEKASEYLDLRRIAASRRAEAGPELARKLKEVLDRTLWVNVDDLSNDPEGFVDDGLPARIDRLGTLEAQGGAVDLKLGRVPRDDGQSIWKVSAETLRQIPALHEEFGYPAWTDQLPSVLVETQIFEAALWQWLVFAVLFVVAGVGALLLEWGFRKLAAAVAGASRREVARVLDVVSSPLRLLIWLQIFEAGQPWVGASVRFSRILGALLGVLWVIALTWLAMRVVEAFSQRIVRRLTERGQLSATALVPIGRRMARFVLLLIGFLFLLRSAGVNVTALVAGLGVGGLAVALAAQKTLENLFGGITIIADAPVRVGDFCRFGDKIGTVEDIGLRSTKIRTLDRTVVAVPNADFASLQIENFGPRDRFLFRVVLGLRYETTSDQLRCLLIELKRLLVSHPDVHPDPARVRFVGLGSSALEVEVFAYLRVPDFDRSLAVREELLLQIMEVVADAGTGFAFPSQTAYMANDVAISPERARAAEARVAAWRASGQSPIEGVAADRIVSLGTEPKPQR
jgi:MscS family membrane protein